MSNQNVPDRQETSKALLHQSGENAGSLIGFALSNMSHGQRSNLANKASEEVLRLEVKQRELHIDYLAGQRQVQEHIDSFHALDKTGNLTRHQLESDIKTGAGTMRIKSTAGPACFVATAVYGDPDHTDVVYLRAFRDNILNRYLTGRWFIRLYWHVGPVLAKYVVKSSLARTSVRGLIEALVGRLQCHYNPAAKS